MHESNEPPFFLHPWEMFVDVDFFVGASSSSKQ